MQTRVLKHRAVLGGVLLLVNDALERVRARDERSRDVRSGELLNLRPGGERDARRHFARSRLRHLARALLAATTLATAATAGLFGLLRRGGRFGRDSRRLRCGPLRLFLKLGGPRAFGQLRLGLFLRLLDAPLALDSLALDALGRGALRRLVVRALCLLLVDDDALELLLLVEEVRDVEERVALKSDVYEGRLHSWEDAHDAPLVNVPDYPLARLAALDVELGDPSILDNRNLLLASVDADNHLFRHLFETVSCVLCAARYLRRTVRRRCGLIRFS